MTVGNGPYLGKFERASDLANLAAPGAFAYDEGPISLSRFFVETHESTAHSSKVHSLFFPIRSKGAVEVEIGGVKARFNTDKSPLTIAPRGAEQAFSFKGQTDNIMVSINADFMESLGTDWSSNPATMIDPIPQMRNARVLQLMLEMYRTVRAGEAGCRIVAESLAMQLSV